MLSGNYKTALSRVRSAKWQSLLTMFGIIIGIVSVITTVSLGEGIKRQVLQQANRLGNDLITVRPGKILSRDKNGAITKVNPALAYGFGTGSLSEQDIAVLHRQKGLKHVSPVSLLSSGPGLDGSQYNEGFTLGTDASFPEVVEQEVEFGNYFTPGEENRQVAVIGKRVAEDLFQENIPIGRTLTIRGQEFIVRGIFKEFGSTTLGQGVDLNKAVFVPRTALNNVAKDATQLVQILVRPEDPKQTAQVMTQVNNALTASHGGQQDITVLRQDENLLVANDMLRLLTTFVTSIAAISLLVGGIGIMNIMLVSVSERTHEIGIRKAIGATNRQIRNQFMAEAVVLSFVGGIVGVVLSYLVNFILRIYTNFQPVITLPVIFAAVGVSLLVGITFGTIPAIKAARKDPIEALRIGG